MFEQVIYLTDSDRKRLNNRYCERCGKHLIRNRNEGLESWINRKYCCKTHMLADRKELGLVYPNFEYKCRYTNKRENHKRSYCITVPKWFTRKYNVFGKGYDFKYTDGKFIIYSKGGKYKIRSSGFKDYCQIGIPVEYVRKYKLDKKLFKFEDKGKNSLFYVQV